MKTIPILVMLVLSVLGIGVVWNGDVDATDSTLSKAVFYVG